MVATGRVPNTKNMGLEDRGIVTNRGFVAVNEKMQVMTQAGDDATLIPNLYCIGDANGKLMLAHAASAQGISAIENIVGRPHVVNHLAIPAAVCACLYGAIMLLNGIYSFLILCSILCSASHILLVLPWLVQRRNKLLKWLQRKVGH